MLPLSPSTDALMRVSIIICAYNAEQRLTEVLEAFLRQSFNRSIHWELIVVDNNSKDNTTKVAERFLERIPNLRIIFEKKQGLIYARRRGYLASKGKIISYIDDDNIVSSNYVESMYLFFTQHPQAGVVGPKILPLIDYEPPAYFDYIKPSLAIRDIGEKEKNITHGFFGHPPGAGMTIPRYLLAIFFSKNRCTLSGRTADSLASGEDTLIALAIRNQGYEWWYNPHCNILHKLPKARMSLEYLTRLFTGFGQCQIEIEEAKRGTELKPFNHIIIFFRHLIRLIFFYLLENFDLKQARRQYFKLKRILFTAAIKSNLERFSKNFNLLHKKHNSY